MSERNVLHGGVFSSDESTLERLKDSASVRFHWTLKRKDTEVPMTYGGYAEEGQAVERRKKEVIKTIESIRSPGTLSIRDKGYSVDTAADKVISWARAEVKFLKIGEVYRPWGKPKRHYIHGENDGFEPDHEH